MDYSKCSHVGQVNDNIKGNTKGCEKCEKIGPDWVHLRICLSCGHVCCFDSSIDKHGTKHFRNMGHPIIKTYGPRENWKWCYKYNLFMI